ncbi:MAG: MFS transporter [Anaerolineales bacterium]
MDISEKPGSPSIKLTTTSRKKLIVLYVLAVAFYWSSLYFYIPTLPIYVKTRVDSLVAVGTILSMYGLWQALIRLPLGIASDWAGWRKPFILGGFLLSAVGAWVMGTTDTGLGLGVGRAITGLAAGTWVPLTVVFSALFPPGEAVRATALLTVVNSLSRMISSGMNGWLNEAGGYPLAFFVAIGAAILAVLVVIPVREERLTPVKPSIKNITALITRPDVLRPSILGALAQYVTWSATLSFTPILAQNLGASDMVQSLLTSGSIGVVTIGNLLTATLTRKVGNRKLAGWSFVLLAAGAILAALVPSLAWLFVAQFVVSVGSGIAHPLFMGMSISKVDRSQRSTAMGLHQAVYGFGMFAGPWISGALADSIGIQPMFAVTGFACLVLGFLGVRWLASTGL